MEYYLKKHLSFNNIINYIKWCCIGFLAINIMARLATIYYYSFFLDAFFMALIICCFGLLFFPAYTRYLLFLFGFSLFLFGFRPYDIESQVYELIVAFIALSLSLTNLKNKGPIRININLFILIGCYISLAMASLLLFPKMFLIKDIYFFGLKNTLYQIFNAIPTSYFYSFAGLNRLLLFSVLSFQLSNITNTRVYFKYLFSGIFIGAVFSCIIGILDYNYIISLAWYRQNTTLSPGALHSTFLNRGWFSEYIIVTVPFAIIGFISKKKFIYQSFILFGALIICEIALFLSGSRAGWVSYPVVLLICWAFFYFRKRGNFSLTKLSLKDCFKVIASVPITIIISVSLVFYIILPLSQHFLDNSIRNNRVKGEENYLVNQTSRLFEPSGRYEVWNHGFNVGRESPVWGMGYESFSMHGHILTKIPKSFYSRNTSRRVRDTPHNIFLQIFVSNGIVGLTIWIVIVFYSLMILFIDLVKSKNYLNIAVIISIVSFHIMGVFQSMQYIPMIWSCIFICFGYAMTIDESILSLRQVRIWRFITILAIIVVAMSVVFYYQNPFTETMKKKYGLNAYALDINQDEYPGFFNLEKGKNGNFRWTGKRAGIQMKAKGDCLSMKVNASTYNSDGREGLEFKVLFNGYLLDQVHFFNGGIKDLRYYLPNSAGEKIKIITEVSRTFNPEKMGLSHDNRELGVMISPVEFQNALPDEGIGFYKWETWGGNGIPGWPVDVLPRFRWTGMQASMNVNDKNDKALELYLICAHPDLNVNPVEVRIAGDRKLITKIKFTENNWEKITISPEEIKGVHVITFKVSRTWNPRMLKGSGDSRDLGIGVAILN